MTEDKLAQMNKIAVRLSTFRKALSLFDANNFNQYYGFNVLGMEQYSIPGHIVDQYRENVLVWMKEELNRLEKEFEAL